MYTLNRFTFTSPERAFVHVGPFLTRHARTHDNHVVCGFHESGGISLFFAKTTSRLDFVHVKGKENETKNVSSFFIQMGFVFLFNHLATPRRLQSPLPPFSSSFPWACYPPVGSSPWPPCAGLPSSSSCSVVCNRCTTFCPLLGLRNGGTV